MGGTSTAPGAGHTWLAKVLAGDPVACKLLALAHDLPDAEWDTFARRVEQIEVGVPVTGAATARQKRSLLPG